MKYLAVIDTNVIVSALLKPNSNPGKVINYIKQDRIVPVYDNSILEEYDEVLRRTKFNISDDERSNIIKEITSHGFTLQKTQTDEVFKDKSDIKFFQIVLTANSIQDSYLVTGNQKDFPQRVFIVDPATMVKIVESNK